MKKRKPFRNGKVHVKRRMCKTCIFRRGNLMHLRAGRRDQMVRDAKRAESTIICHETLLGKQAACYGFFAGYATAPLQIAERMKLIEWD